MGQYWMILDIDKRERLSQQEGSEALGDRQKRHSSTTVHWLARPASFQRNELPSKSQGLTGSTESFSKLPVELFIMLTDFLTASDAICLALTCRAMRRSLKVRLQEALIAHAAPWSGRRIITLGEYSHNYPSGMLTEAEEAKLQQTHFEDGNLARGALYRDVSEHYAEAKLNNIRQTAEKLLDSTDAMILLALISPLYNSVDGENLSKHEHVHGDALVKLCGSKTKAQQPSVQPIGFGELIALRKHGRMFL